MSVKFELNQPVRLALTRIDPKYNELYKTLMYSVCLEDGTEDKMFLPEEYGDTMRGIKVREVFTICKRKTVQRSTYYEIRTATMEPPADERPTKLESQLEASIHHVKAQRAQPPSKVVAPAVATQQDGQIPVPSHGTELSNLLASCMVAAIDAAVLARDYAHAKGLTIALGEESIQDLTSTLMIHLQKMAELDRRYPTSSTLPAAGGNVRAWRQ